MISKKVINFLFIGDIVKLKLYDNIVRSFVVNDVLYYNPSSSTNYYSILLTECSESSDESMDVNLYIDLHSKDIIVSHIYTNDDEIESPAAEKMHLDRINLKDIIHQEKFIEGEKHYYCKSFCHVRSICGGNDKNCEYYSKVGNEDIPFVGDRVNYFKGNFKGKVPSTGTIIRIKSTLVGGEEHLTYGVIDDTSKLYHNTSRPVVVIERKSIVIGNSPCSSCFIKSCNKCDIKMLKDLDFIYKNG